MSLLTAVSRSPRGIYDINDYPGLKLGTITVSAREFKLADAGDEMVQEMLCDRYAASIHREGADVQWALMRSHMVFVASAPHTPPGVAGMVQKLKMAVAKVR